MASRQSIYHSPSALDTLPLPFNFGALQLFVEAGTQSFPLINIACFNSNIQNMHTNYTNGFSLTIICEAGSPYVICCKI